MPATVTRDAAGAGQTVCVLGGTGFVGSRLVAHLAGQGYSLRVPSRKTTGSALRVCSPQTCTTRQPCVIASRIVISW